MTARTTAGTYTATFDVPAPRGARNTAVDYDVEVVAWPNTNCTSGTSSAATSRQDAIRVVPPSPNDDLEESCALNLILVLDASSSITAALATQVRQASIAFLNALAGTGARVSIVEFSTDASRPVPHTPVTEDSIRDTFRPYLYDRYRPSGYTNRQAALQEVYTANAHSGTTAVSLSS